MQRCMMALLSLVTHHNLGRQAVTLPDCNAEQQLALTSCDTLSDAYLTMA